MTACRCQFCNHPLEPVQEFRFLVESETLAEPAYLSRIRRLPATADGKPLRVCDRCQSQLEARPVQFRDAVERAAARRQLRSGMLAAVGLYSAGWMLGTILGVTVRTDR